MDCAMEGGSSSSAGAFDVCRAGLGRDSSLWGVTRAERQRALDG
jgi:hypothetical protein